MVRRSAARARLQLACFPEVNNEEAGEDNGDAVRLQIKLDVIDELLGFDSAETESSKIRQKLAKRWPTIARNDVSFDPAGSVGGPASQVDLLRWGISGAGRREDGMLRIGLCRPVLPQN